MTSCRLGEVLTGGPFGSIAVFVHDSRGSGDAMWVWTERHGVHKTLRIGWVRSPGVAIPATCRDLVALAQWSKSDTALHSALRDAMGS